MYTEVTIAGKGFVNPSERTQWSCNSNRKKSYKN